MSLVVRKPQTLKEVHLDLLEEAAGQNIPADIYSVIAEFCSIKKTAQDFAAIFNFEIRMTHRIFPCNLVFTQIFRTTCNGVWFVGAFVGKMPDNTCEELKNHRTDFRATLHKFIEDSDQPKYFMSPLEVDEGRVVPNCRIIHFSRFDNSTTKEDDFLITCKFHGLFPNKFVN